MEMQSLQEIGLKYETDKATYHKFCNFYENYVKDIRFEKIKLLEVGVYKGASLRMWREYFPNAEIHGIDIIKYQDTIADNVKLHCLNAEDADQISSFTKNYGNWDIIIDDGGHTMKQQQMAFKHLWKTLKNNGIFIMEDLHTSFESYKKDYNSNNDPTTYQMIDSLKNKKYFCSPYISLDEYKIFLHEVNFIDIWTRDSNDMNLGVTSIIKKNEIRI